MFTFFSQKVPPGLCGHFCSTGVRGGQQPPCSGRFSALQALQGENHKPQASYVGSHIGNPRVLLCCTQTGGNFFSIKTRGKSGQAFHRSCSDLCWPVAGPRVWQLPVPRVSLRWWLQRIHAPGPGPGPGFLPGLSTTQPGSAVQCCYTECRCKTSTPGTCRGWRAGSDGGKIRCWGRRQIPEDLKIEDLKIKD